MTLYPDGYEIMNLIKNFFRPSHSTVLLDIPKKTLALDRNPQSKACWWDMDSANDQQAMQIFCDVTVRNICKHDIFVTAAKLKNPEVLGYGDVNDLDSQYSGRHMIPNGSKTDLRFNFRVTPLVREKGQTFKADVAIIDVFGNEHWMKGIDIPYSKRDPF